MNITKFAKNVINSTINASHMVKPTYFYNTTYKNRFNFSSLYTAKTPLTFKNYYLNSNKKPNENKDNDPQKNKKPNWK
jgi:hypothetical protein